MGRDLLEEQALLDLSRCQRAALERWMLICVDAGEIKIAEEIRQGLTAVEMEVAA